MNKIFSVFLGVAAFATAAPLQAGEPDAYVYTYEGRTNVIRGTKASELLFDMPLKNGDVYKAEADCWIDFVFFRAVGLRFIGPGEITARSVTSLSGIEVRASGGSALLHIENPGETIGFSLETPNAFIRSTEPLLAYVTMEPPDKKGKGARTTAVVKKGRLEVVVKSSDAAVRVIENQKLTVDDESYIPPAQGVSEEEVKPAERARTIYVPKKGKEDF